jgi:hypothetical protein
MKRAVIVSLMFLLLASVCSAQSFAQAPNGGYITPNLGLPLPSPNQGLYETLTQALMMLDQVASLPPWGTLPYAPTMTLWTTCAWNYIVLAGNVTISFTPTPFSGQSYSLMISQPATGGPYTVTWRTPITWTQGSGNISSTPNVSTCIFCSWTSTGGWSCQE